MSKTASPARTSRLGTSTERAGTAHGTTASGPEGFLALVTARSGDVDHLLAWSNRAEFEVLPATVQVFGIPHVPLLLSNAWIGGISWCEVMDDARRDANSRAQHVALHMPHDRRVVYEIVESWRELLVDDRLTRCSALVACEFALSVRTRRLLEGVLDANQAELILADAYLKVVGTSNRSIT